MATGTNSTEIDELKEMVRQLTNRVDILSASNTDLNTKLVKAKELFDAQAADLNARLVKSQEQVRDMERAIFASRKESDKITLPVWPTTQGFARWRESVLAITVAASGDKAAAAKFVSEVDNPNIELAAFVTNRPDEMISIDSKCTPLFSLFFQRAMMGTAFMLQSKDHVRVIAGGKRSEF